MAPTSQPGVKVSLHNRPGKGVLAVVANTGANAQQAQLSFDLAGLTQPVSLAARGVLADKDMPLSGGKIGVALGPLENAVIRLKAR